MAKEKKSILRALVRWVLRVIFVLLIALLCFSSAVRPREAANGPLAGYTYLRNPFTLTVTLVHYHGEESSVTVPAACRLHGVPFRVKIYAPSLFHGNQEIVSVRFDEGVRFAWDTMNGLFSGCTSLIEADLKGADTRGVRDMGDLFMNCKALTRADMTGIDASAVENISRMFSNCGALEKLIGYEALDTSSLMRMHHAFSGVKKLEIIDLSAWDLSRIENSSWCFQSCGAKEIRLPDNLAVISAGFMNHAAAIAGEVFSIPPEAKAIGYAHTFYDFATEDFTRFSVPPENRDFSVINGALYTADGSALLAVPRGMAFDGGVFALPEGVVFLPELCFSRNRHFHTLVLPDSYEIRPYVPLHDPQYRLNGDSGNINAGSSLSIALYMYTAVTDYAVKDSHPLYRAENGLLFSRDMRTLVAVPARYDRRIIIPEGVRSWQTYAMWAEGSAGVDRLMENCPGVQIPASLTDIAQDQIDMLNRLAEKKYNECFEIAVSPDHPVYRVDEAGYLTCREENAEAGENQ